MVRVTLADVSPLAETGGAASTIWWTIIIALLGSSVIGGLVTNALASLRASAAARREGYALAIRTLISRAEYPYRVRRRVSDEAEVLAGLAARGNDLQEQLAECRTWVHAESRTVGRVYEEALAAIDADVHPATQDAWNLPPITSAAAMNLNGWGTRNQWPKVKIVEDAISSRFGWRRLLPTAVWPKSTQPDIRRHTPDHD